MADVARSERGVATLHEATGGDVSRAPSTGSRWSRSAPSRRRSPALRTASGEIWGALALYREPGQRCSTPTNSSFLRTVSTHLAEGARRGLLIGEATDPEGPEAPGLLVLDDQWEVESLTPGVEHWLQELPDGDWRAAGQLPAAVLAVAGSGAAHRGQPDVPGRDRLRARALALRTLDRAARCVARLRRTPPRRCDRGTRSPRPHRAAADGGLRPDRARARSDAAGAPGRLRRARSPRPRSSRLTPSRST